MGQVFIPEIVSPSERSIRAKRRHESKLARADLRAENIRLVRDIISNPVVELIAGIAAITYLNKGSGSWLESTTGIDLAAGGEYAGLVAIIGLQQVAPLARDLIKSPAAGEALRALPLAALAL